MQAIKVKNKEKQTPQKVQYCTWEDLESDREQQAIYKEIAEINAYIQRRAYERAKAK